MVKLSVEALCIRSQLSRLVFLMVMNLLRHNEKKTMLSSNVNQIAITLFLGLFLTVNAFEVEKRQGWYFFFAFN